MNAKKKGNKGENAFANWLVANGIKAWKDGASGGGNNEKADIGNNLNIHFEVKTVKKINLMETWKKALHECAKTHNDPVLAVHFDGMPEGKWLMVLDSDHFIDLLTKEGVVNDYQDPKFKYKLVALRNLTNELIKILK